MCRCASGSVLRSITWKEVRSSSARAMSRKVSIMPCPQVKDRPRGGRETRGVGPDSSLERCCEEVQVLLPLVGLIELLRQQIVDGRTPSPAGQLLGNHRRPTEAPRGTTPHLED